ncbi:DUF1294 domain-containing protein [Flavobacterium agricola]|uniref:DUF1294 domain-containing protein n=1 Tax=Flavobacterium agricola TaxID=2870839 RepID=A0ABY6LXL6_9FLAO|nr:DUF1294 domain-containing protein [Flavobacterium agricola]UYW00916.1 DUF1294 domain-containing protein [Flavobacterium agricola]
MGKAIGIYLLLINVFTLTLFGYDKDMAEKGKRRVSEKTLLIFTFLGGTLGALIGMRMYKHKTNKASFQIKFLLTFIAQLFVYFFTFRR